MKHLGFASLAALKQYERYAHANQINTRPILEKLGLTENLDQAGEGRIRGDQFQRYLSELLTYSKDETMGLRSAHYVESHSYSLLGTLVEQSHTLGNAIERIPLYERLVGDMGHTEIERRQRSLRLVWQCHYDDEQVVPHMVDNVLASWTLFAKWLTHSSGNSAARPECVRLKRPAPSGAIRRLYESVFGSDLRFGEKINAIEISSSLLSLPVRGAQPEYSSTLEGKARSELSLLTLEGESFTDRVKRSILAHLQLGIASKSLIAREFNLSERHFQRRLSAEGTSYRALLDTLRKERALNFLHDTELSVSEIAHNLGYQDERCLFRSVKRWMGTTPEQVRAAQN